jgi:hypothetical protein
VKRDNSRSQVRPLLGRYAHKLRSVLTGRSLFSTSVDYWEERYRNGGNSGAGSYNRLAVFKADVLNHFVSQNGIQSVIEFGSGDGAQLELARYPQYIGVDVSPSVVELTRRRFAHDSSIQILHTSEFTDGHRAELALSLDVIYHLVEDEIFEDYMNRLFGSATEFVIIYSSNEDGSAPSPHVRHRHVTRWVDDNINDFSLINTIPNPYPFAAKDPDNTSFADFFIYART